MISNLKLDANILHISISKDNDESQFLWYNFTKILSDFPKAKINCGNCEFTGEEWKEYLLNTPID